MWLINISLGWGLWDPSNQGRGGMGGGARWDAGRLWDRKKNKSKVLYIIKFFDKNISQDAVTPWDI
jgi:hypothetical protein